MKSNLKPKLMQAHLSTVILVALMPIKHDGTDYKAGQVLEATEKDAVFLRMGGCVREPTADELEAYEQSKIPLNPPLQNRETKSEPPAQEVTALGMATSADEPVTGTPVNVPMATAPIEDVKQEAQVMKDKTGAADTEDKADSVKAAVTSDTDQPINPYEDWEKKDLNAELDKRGIEHNAKARNDELEALLIEDDAKKIAASETAQTGE